ncbi:MAG TPA: sodium:solute symporter family protein, partial [Planctomycetota bacterium]|nr:sodium:solute symporter family protein [Planctomycetota bacterium]
LAPLDYAVVLAYSLAIFAVGLKFAKRGGESVASYFVSGRSLPWWLAGASMVATSFAADTPLWITGLMRSKGGVAANWYWWSFLFGHVLAVFVFAKLWRRAEVMTNIEITEVRFAGRPAAALRLMKSLYLALPINLGVIVWCTLAMQKVLEAVLGVSRMEATAVCLVLSVAYVLHSGLWGVVATDLVQFVVALAGACALAFYAVGAAGGVAALPARLDALHGAGHGLLDLLPRFDGAAGWWSPATSGFFVYVGVLWWSSRNVDGGGALVQRMLACKNEKHAVGATLTFTVLHYAVRTWPWVLAALASFVLFPLASTGAATTNPALAAFAGRVAKDPEFAYPAMIALLPAGLKGLLLAAFFASFASTVSSFLNLSASYLLNDFYRRFVRPGAGEAHYLAASKAIVVLLTVVATALAYAAHSIDQVFSFLLAFSGGIGLVYVGRWVWWRINAYAEITAMVASGITATAISALPHLSPAAFARYEALRERLLFDPTAFRLLVTVAVTSVATLAAAFFAPATDRKTLLDFYLRARPPGFWGPIRAEAARYLPRPERSSVAVTALACVASAALIIAMTAGIGDLCFGRMERAAAMLAVAAVSGAVAVRAGIATVRS